MAGGAAVEKQVLFVSATVLDEPPGVEILLGEYREIGKNHGKPVFRRKRNEDQPDIYIYFWDKRDGPEFTGWWFGEAVGTSHVWSRCELPTASIPAPVPSPPAQGWRIPWDGAVKADLRIRRAKAEVKEERLSKDELPLEQQEEKLLVCMDQVAFAEAESTEVLDSAVAMLEGEVTQDAAEAVVELVQTQLEVLMQAHRFVAAEIIMARKEAPKVLTRLQKLTPRVRAVQGGLAQVLKEAKTYLAPQAWHGRKEAPSGLMESELTPVTNICGKGFQPCEPVTLPCCGIVIFCKSCMETICLGDGRGRCPTCNQHLRVDSVGVLSVEHREADAAPELASAENHAGTASEGASAENDAGTAPDGAPAENDAGTAPEGAPAENDAGTAPDGAPAENDDGAGVLSISENRQQCLMCCQMHIIVGQGMCEACNLGRRFCFRYECARCHRIQEIPHPMWRYQKGPNDYGTASWACHEGCDAFTHWRIIPEDVSQVPATECPESWGHSECPAENC
ncbi:unnamed protein product [Cladocopium goreaui]|uniref:Uncharacterized protein n=1 Tax=Cladocopium goreaui TaxID=2562237 RepID=A0A9P1D3C0_9DINO|nr:unnamed protein product [Cladocopium goreaui]